MSTFLPRVLCACLIFLLNMPAQPGGFKSAKVTWTTTSTMLLKWADSVQGVTSYSIYGSTNNTVFTQYADVSSDTSFYAATHLLNNTRYYWKIIAHSSAGMDTSLVFSDSTHCNMAGTFSIGPTGYFQSIGQALDSMPLKGMTGSVVLELQAGYNSSVESFPLVCHSDIPCRQQSYALTLRPANGAPAMTITNTTTAPLIVLDSTFNVTIDGRPGGIGNTQGLTLSGAGPVIDCRNSTNNTFTYLGVHAALNQLSGNLIVLEGAAGQGSSNNIISSCDISGLNNTVASRNLIYSTATNGVANSNNKILNCNLHEFSVMGIFLDAGNNGWVIRNNSFYASYGFYTDTANAGMITSTDSGHPLTDSITDNYFGGTLPQCTGTPMNIIFTDNVELIACAGNVDIRNNIIQRIDFGRIPRSGGIYPSVNIIRVGGDPYQGTLSHTVFGNTIGGIATADSINFGNLTTVQLPVDLITDKSPGGVLTVSENKMQNIWLRKQDYNDAPIDLVGISTSNSTNAISNNIIGDGGGAPGIGNFTAAGVLGISDYGFHIQVSNNKLTGWTGQGVLTGITAGNGLGVGGGSLNVSQNTIGGLRTSFSDPNGSVYYRVAGLLLNKAWGGVISGNTIYGLKAPAGNIWCLSSTDGDPAEHIDGNFIHPVQWTGPADSVMAASYFGINLLNDQSLVQNNMIKLGPDSSGTPVKDLASFYGIQSDQGSTNEIRHNSIYIDGKGVLPGLNTSACISLFTASSVHVYNNILVNRRSAAIAGNSSYHYIIWNNAGGYNDFDHNIYFFDGVNSIMSSYYGYYQDLTKFNSWRMITGNDLHSIFADPNFINPGGSSAFLNLHLAATTPAEGKGDTAHTALTDYDGQTRSALTPTDLGADAGNFTLRDAWPPVLVPDSIPDHQKDSAQVITVKITDDSGIDSTSGAGPAMWFRKFSPFIGNWYHVAGTLVSGSAKKGTWKFKVDYSTFGQPVNAGDSFQCYFVAQDTTLLHNIGFAPLQNANHTHPDVQDTLPVTLYKYKVRGMLPDTLFVGAGQSYTSLTNAGGAFQSLNTAAASAHGAVIVITSDLSESGTYALTGYRDSSGIQVITSTPVLKTITNSSVVPKFTGLIQFIKSRNIVINGAVNNTGKYLKFVNTNNTSDQTPCLFFGDSARDIVIRHTIVGSDDNGNYSSAAIGIYFSQDNTNVLIDSCLIGNGTAGNTTTNGIYSSNPVSGLKIINNEIFNTNRAGIELWSVGDSCIIQNNHIYYNNTHPVGSWQNRYGIGVNSFAGGPTTSGGHIISGNYIGGSSTFCGGAPWLYTASSTSTNLVFDGIVVQSSATRPSYVYNNVIENINMTSASSVSFYGISAYGNVDIGGRGGNIIGNPSVPGDITNAGSLAGAGLYTYGIQLYQAYSASIVNNKISNLSAPGAGNMSVAGVFCANDQDGNMLIKNDTVRLLSSAGTQNPNNLSYPTPFSVAGIAIKNGRTNYVIEHNEISSLHSASTAGTITAGIFDLSMRCPVTIARNRIYDLTNLATSGGEIAGISVTGNAHLVINNQLSLTNGGNTNALLVSGIKDSTAGMNGLTIGSRYFYNSVLLAGAASSGSLNSYAANFQTNVPVAGFRNNLLYNARSGGTGAHFALGINMPVNAAQLWPAASSDFNVLVTRDSAATAVWQGGNALNLSSFQSLSSGDASSYALPISALAANSLFSDTARGNLDINTANNLCWTLNGKGIPIYNISGDLDSSANVRSTAIRTGATDIGSDEFNPAVPPPVMSIQGHHQPGGSDTLSLNGRPLSIVSWGNTGVLPSLGSAAWYSGIWPNDTTNDGHAFLARYMNSYWSIPATGGSGYTYSITFFYDSAMLGKIEHTDRMVINKREPNVPGSWIQLPGVVDTVRHTITATGLTSFSEFTVTDSLADLQNGMPAPDLAITALHLDAAQASGGSTLGLNFTVANQGNAPAPTDTVYLYLSTDSILTPGTTLLGTVAVAGSLPAGATSDTVKTSVVIPCTKSPGAYYLFAQADGGHKIIQSGNSDHSAWTALSLTAGPPVPGKPLIHASPALTTCSPDTVILSIDPSVCSSCTYTWSNGVTSALDTVKAAGTYAVAATNVCGSAVSDSITVPMHCVVTGVPVIDGLEFLQARPDPTSGPVVIHFRLNRMKKVGCNVLDNAGRIVLSKASASMYGDQTLEMDLSHVSGGTYYLQISFDGVPQVIKILVVR